MKRYAALSLLLIMCLLVFSGCKRPAKTTDAPLTWQEQYDLGLRYLSEGNYEEAIIAFQAAIAIDPAPAESYLRLAEAYQASGDIVSAAEILERGFSQTKDLRLKNALAAIHANEKLNKEKREMLDAFEVALKAGDNQRIYDLLVDYGWGLEDEDRVSLMSLQSDTDNRRLAYTDGAFYGNMTGIGLVPSGMGAYYGELRDGVPHGHGSYLNMETRYQTGAIDASIFKGQWDNGIAIGAATVSTGGSGVHEDDISRTGEITCVIGENEIMVSGKGWDYAIVDGIRHGVSYDIVDGVAIEDAWELFERDGDRYKECELHGDCGYSFFDYEPGTQRFRNLYPWNDDGSTDAFRHPDYCATNGMGLPSRSHRTQ